MNIILSSSKNNHTNNVWMFVENQFNQFKNEKNIQNMKNDDEEEIIFDKDILNKLRKNAVVHEIGFNEMYQKFETSVQTGGRGSKYKKLLLRYIELKHGRF